jgi:hypothetical protein
MEIKIRIFYVKLLKSEINMADTLTGFSVSVEISLWIGLVTVILAVIWTLRQGKGTKK